MSLDVTIVGESEDTPVINYTPDPIDEYMVIVNLPEDWEVVHNYIINENEIDGIPNRKVECSNDQPFSLRTSIYMMSAAEVEVLKTHPKVETVELNPDKYPQPQSIDAYRYKKNVAFNKPLLTAGQGSESTGYTNGVRSNWSHLFLTNPTSTPYKGVGITTTDTTDSDVIYSLTGKNVDAVTIDTGVGILHPEFIAGDGTYRVQDVILDGPYKVDPDFFNADPTNRLETVTIDGVSIGTRAKESVARDWWANTGTSYRSAAYASIGTATISSSYTRIHAHSKNGTNAVTNSHGTSCASQIGGKSFGLAIEANLWNIRIALGGAGGVVSGDTSLNICTIWHKAKKIQSGNPDPTILNNSWGSTGSTGNSSGTSYSHVYRGQSLTYTGSGSAGTIPANSGSCRNNKYFTVHTGSPSTLAYNGDGQYTNTGSTTNTAAENAIAAGVIVVSSAGNTNQKLSDKNDVDFDNLYGGYAYVNRTGGVQQGFSGDHERYKGTIRVGALDCAVEPHDEKQGSPKYSIRKVVYSANGPMINIWAPAEYTMSAAYASGEDLQRTDNSSFYDHWFNGTSSACPNTVSLLCLFLESNRSANQDVVRHWLDTSGSTPIALSDPYSGVNDTGYWSLNYNSTYDQPTIEWDGYNVRGNGNLRGATNRVLTNPYASNTLPTIRSSKGVVEDGLVLYYSANNTYCYEKKTFEFDVTNSGSGAYTISGTDRNGTVSGNNPSISIFSGDLLKFKVDASGHPFWVKTVASTGTGSGASQVTNNGDDDGTVTFDTSTLNTGTYYYNCQYHSSMQGTISNVNNKLYNLVRPGDGWYQSTPSPYYLDGTITWGTSFSSDNGGVWDFSSSQTQIQNPVHTSTTFGTGDFAFEFWVNPDDFGSRGTFFDSRPSNGTTGITIGHESSSGEIRVYMNATSGSDIVVQSSDFVAGQWQHIVVTRLSGTVSLFINGVLKDSGTRTSDLNNNSSVIIGYKTYTSSTYDYFDGKIGEIRIYKGSGLTQAQAKHNYDTTKARYNSLSDTIGLVSYGDSKITAGDAIKGLQFHTHPEDVIVGQPAETYQKSYGAVVRYQNSSSTYKSSFIVSNNEFSSATVYDDKTDTGSSQMGGFSASKTHMYYKGYWGNRQMIRLSDLTFTGQYKYNGQSPYTYNNSYPNNLIGANWSANLYYATNNTSEPMGDFTQSTLKTTAGISTSGSGYIHGTASMNGITLWASGYQGGGMDKSRIFKSTDGGVNFTEVYSISPYSFGGYLGAYPHYNGGKFMWWVGADSTNKVFSSSDGETWTDEGAQSSGPGAPTYHGFREIVYNKYTCKFYRCWNSQQVMSSSDGVTWSQETSFTPAHWNMVVMYDGSMLGMQIDGTNAKFYKYPRSGHKIDWTNSTLLNTSSISSNISSVNSPTIGLWGFTAHSSGG
tara:strand:+ start:478 stop:4686 length:4209 start_codon:yes stop_codon:yes gene_type:complete